MPGHVIEVNPSVEAVILPARNEDPAYMSVQAQGRPLVFQDS